MSVPLDDAEELMTEHEQVVTFRRHAEEAFGDLPVGAADADLERPHQHLTLAGAARARPRRASVCLAGRTTSACIRASRSRRVGKEDGALGGRADEGAIASEDSAGVAERRRLPGGEALGDLGVVQRRPSSVSASTSIVIVSPSRTTASGPPRAASGAT